MKAATWVLLVSIVAEVISIHAAREGGDYHQVRRTHKNAISIHAAREGGDADNPKILPVLNISIHAAREGGDGCRIWYNLTIKYFNPRRP